MGKCNVIHFGVATKWRRAFFDLRNYLKRQ
jgi:hypothetical protein